MMHLYGASADKGDHTLNDLRRRLFELKKASGDSYVQSKYLPPTSCATGQHSLRVMLQVWTWTNIFVSHNSLRPEEWGWKLEKGMLVPVYTTRGAAPDELLKTIRCGCKGDCSTKRCTCKKHGLDCTSACKECAGVSCSNTTQIRCTDIDDDDDEDME